MVLGTKRFRFVLQAFMASAAILGSVALVIGRGASDPRERSAHLLDLLEKEPQSASGRTQDSSAQQSRHRMVPEMPPGAAWVSLPIRVALVSQTPIRSVQPGQGTVCQHSDGRPVLSGRLMIAAVELRKDALHCSGGKVLINGRSYSGQLELSRRGDGLIAINRLDLEDYVASVVGAEMPSHWHAEALKAQAVAARSYALVHLARPAAQDYHLGDTTRWQVFAGDQSRTSRTEQATKDTRGIILSYRGGIVESLYASDQAISDEAHGHLGASMSQHGAQRLAVEGQRFNEILGNFYRGASLARLRRDGL